MPKRMPDLESHPPIPCWFCGRGLEAARVVHDGILRAREEREGGPQRLFICPSCLKENLCEETLKGRWFASPNVTVGLLDILFSQLPGAATEEVLQAISWYRENEERRRAYFKADGDSRYQGLGRSFIFRLWPWAGEEPAAPPPRLSRARPSGARSSSDAGGSRAHSSRAGAAGEAGRGSRSGGRPGEGERARAKRPPPREPPRPRPHVPTPHEVLGLSSEASPDEIRRAFHRLAVQYHPDKVHHLGEAFVAVATVKFRELKRAYDVLMEGPGRRAGR